MPEAVGVLRVAGVSVLAIEYLELFQLEGKINNSEKFQEIRTVLARTVARGELTEGNSVIEAIAKTLACNTFAGSFQPRYGALPDLDTCKEVVTKFLSREYVYNAEEFERCDRWYRALACMSGYCLDAQIFTAGSFIGLARGLAQTGDRVCVFFGHDCPMLLRLVSDSKFLVVGECFMHHLSEGQALLGNLPNNVQAVRVEQPSGGRRWGFKDSNSGNISYEDPRLSSFPIDHTQYRRSIQKEDPDLFYIKPEDFRRPGFNIEYFDLI
jgi:hypothetical protein